MDNEVRGLSTVIGLAAIGPASVGIAGFIGAVFPFFNGDFVGAGLLLIASAISFGFLALAVLGR